MDADIADRRMRAMVARQMNQRLRDAVDEGLGPDEAMVGQHVGAGGHMLAAAEADLEMQRTRLSLGVAEQPRRAHLALCRYRYLRQQIVDQILLARAQRSALRPAIEPVERRRIA